MWAHVAESWQNVLSLDTLVAVVWMLVLWFASQTVKLNKRQIPTVQAFDAGVSYWAKSPLLDNDYKSSSKQIVPASVLFAICSVVPIVVFFILSLFDTCTKATALRIQGIMYAFSGAALCIDCIKQYCGYWRPYFYDGCGFDAATGKCTKDDYSEMRKSFPSGHAGLSMVTMLYTSYCILGACRLGRPLRIKGVDLGGMAVAAGLLPFGLALFVAASRVVDNDHWPADVVGGIVIGGSFATLYYHRYFPVVFEAESHLPRAAFVSESLSQGSGEESLLVGAASASA